MTLLGKLLGKNIYTMECFNSKGFLKWSEVFNNLITNQGLNDNLDKYLKGIGYTAAWFVGIIDDVGWVEVAADDTAAKISDTANHPTTNDWQEFDDYSEAVRQTLTLGTVAGQSVNNSASKASYSINATGVVRGAFVVSSSVKGGASGVLYAAGAFASTRSVESGDTLNVTITLANASA